MRVTDGDNSLNEESQKGKFLLNKGPNRWPYIHEGYIALGKLKCTRRFHDIGLCHQWTIPMDDLRNSHTLIATQNHNSVNTIIVAESEPYEI